MDAHHTIQMADIVIHLQSTQSPQNQLMNHSPPKPNSPLPDLLPSEISLSLQSYILKYEADLFFKCINTDLYGKYHIF